MDKNSGQNPIVVKNIGELEAVATSLLNHFKEYRIFVFYGDLGTGKTTLIKKICSLLGVENSMSSPSFSIVNEYITDNDQTIYHFDLYRLKTIDEVFDIGYEEYIYNGSYCFIEWPEKIEPLLPENIVKVYINADPIDNSRIIRFEHRI